MSRRGENIYKRKDGRWEGRYIKERNAYGQAVYGYVYAPTYTEVRRKMIYAVAAAIEKDSHSQMEPNHGEDNTSALFNSIANDWLCYIEPQIKESTYAKYSNELFLYVFPAFEGMKIEDITISQLESLSATLLKTGGTKQCGLSSKTVGDTFAIIKRIIYYADQKGFKTSYTGKEVRIKQAAKDFRVLNITEQRIFAC